MVLAEIANQTLKISNHLENALIPFRCLYSGYLLLGEKLLSNDKLYADCFNFGPNKESILTVADVTKMIIDYYEKGEMFVHKKDDLHEANLLMLNIEKAENVLGWIPTFTANEAIKETVEWYKRFYNGQNVIDFTFSQIDKYQKKINFKDKQNETIINTIN